MGKPFRLFTLSVLMASALFAGSSAQTGIGASMIADGFCLPANANNVKIYDNGVWWIEKSADNPRQQAMVVSVNGVNKGTTYALQFGHSASGLGWPVIAVIYNTGYVRLTPPGQLFGTSFILGPAYWDSSNTYFHNVQISRVEIDTSDATPSGPLHFIINARDYRDTSWPNYRLDITYDITLPDPAESVTLMSVTQTYRVANAFTLSVNHQALHEGFKWMQFSSMYIDNPQHDSDGVRYVDSSGVLQQADFADVGCNTFIFSSPTTLSTGSRWAMVRHGDDLGWQGNTPNTLVSLDSANIAGHTVPQGYVTCTSDPNDDNVGAWLNNEAAPPSFAHGNTGSITYTLIAEDDPIATQALRSQATYDGWVLESSENSNQGSTMSNTATLFYLGDNAAKKQYRAILSFNTAGLPDNAVITKVTLKIKRQGLVGTNPFTTHGNILVDIRKGAFSGDAALQLGDFQAAASKNAVGNIHNTPTGGWYTKTWTSGIFSYINKTGLTQFRLRFQTDDDNDNVADYLKFYSGNAGTASYRPQLIVEYYVP